jgi:hypothetical protein
MVETAIKPVKIRDGFAPDLLASFAGMLIEFGRLERVVYLAIKSLKRTGYSDGLKHALRQWQFQKVCEELQRLYTKQYGEGNDSDWLKSFVVDAERFAAVRNDLVHAMWTIDDAGNPLAMRVRLDRKTRQLEEASGLVDQTVIDELTKSMKHAWKQLNRRRRGWGPVEDKAA